MDMKRRIEVVAALIHREIDGEEKFLICQRNAQKSNALLWEFVGGKVEEGESLAAALTRECAEELDIDIAPGELYSETEHEYPDVIVHLSLLQAEIVGGELHLKEHADMRWITAIEISQFQFCPADTKFLMQILYDDSKKRIAPGKWKHFKGNSYEVVGIAKHSETLEPMVIYRALYGNGDLWTRPVSMWLEQVTMDGRTFPRFTYEGSSDT